MPAPPPALYVENVLEDAIVTLDPDGPTEAEGLERLEDRDIGLPCTDSGTAGERILHFDRGVGASTPTVDVWIISGSGYTGELLTLETSPDDTAWTERATVTPASDDPQRVAIGTPFAMPRYARIVWEDSDNPVAFTEVFVSPELAFTWKPAAPALRETQRPNVVLVESASGRAWGVQRGTRRWSTDYVMTGSPDADYTQVLAILDTLADGAKPFWLLDVRSVLRWVRMSGAVALQSVDFSLGEWDIPLTLVEELP